MDMWKKYIRDWSIKEESKIIEAQYKNIKLFKINFPNFWLNAYKNKNNFYKHVYFEAKQHVINGLCGKEWLENEKCQELWHRHCEFCFREINTETKCKCFCTEDITKWICSDCYNLYKRHFDFVFETIDDIPYKSIKNIIGIVVNQEGQTGSK